MDINHTSRLTIDINPIQPYISLVGWTLIPCARRSETTLEVVLDGSGEALVPTVGATVLARVRHPGWMGMFFLRKKTYYLVDNMTFLDIFFVWIFKLKKKKRNCYILLGEMMINQYLVGGDWNMNFYFSIYWEGHHPNRLSYFQRGRSTTNQLHPFGEDVGKIWENSWWILVHRRNRLVAG